MIFDAKQVTVLAKQTGKCRLRDFTAAIHVGEWITLIGENGSGKSTLAAFIAAYQLEQFKVEGEIKSHLGAVPIVTQMTSEYLIGATPYEDLIISLEQFGEVTTDIDSIIQEIAEELHIEHLLHKDIDKLSGGEKQLVAVAGSLLMKAKLLILDEITSMLSEHAKATVIPLIRAYCKKNNIAVVWITQQLDELLSSDTVWVMQQLTLLYSGNAQLLFEGKRGETIADQLRVPIPWTIQKQQQLTEQDYRFTEVIFNMKQLAMEVNAYGAP